MKRILTGVRATNNLHIGNYFGIIPSITDNIDSEIFLFVADLHSLTNDNRSNYYEIMKLFIACFGDKANINYYIQSQFMHFAYLTWILTCNTPLGELKRMTQFKSQDEKDTISSGYLFYPMLMCADILLPRATHIPIGYDQIQHIELVRNVAENMNKKFDCNFIIPEYIISESCKIMDLMNVDKKMSKSNYSDNSTIYLRDTPNEIRRKIMHAKTDSLLMPENVREIKDTRREIYNLCSLFTYTTGESFEYIERNFANGYTSKFKEALVTALVNKFNPIRIAMNNITDEQVDYILDSRFSYVNEILTTNLNEIKEKVLKYIKD